MDYQEAREYLDSLFRFGSVLGTGRMSRLMEGLGDPQDHLRYLHVAGTNGKGSVTAMASRIMEAAGHKVGRFISPYLEDFTERISINSDNIPEDRVADILTRIRPLAEAMVKEGNPPTEFEVVTALGFVYFFEEKCDIVSLEVGLGGRSDATNVIRRSEVSAITRIGMDHTDRLGDTLEQIAYEKAGIIRRQGVVVSAPQRPEALQVLEDICGEMGAELHVAGRDILWEERCSSIDGQVIDLRGIHREYPGVKIPLLGRHQQENAAVALGAVEHLRVRGMEISLPAIYEGFEKVIWPGRMEILMKRPMVLIDSAHNKDGASVLHETVKSSVPHRQVVLVLGVLADKDVASISSQIASLASRIVVTRPLSPRAMDPHELAERLRENTSDVRAVETIPEALDIALDMTKPDDLLLIAGSVYLAGPARSYLRSKNLELSGTSGIYL